MLSWFSHVQVFETLWTIQRSPQAPLSMRILQARISEWVACPPPENLPDQGIEPASLMSPSSTGRFFTTSTTI